MSNRITPAERLAQMQQENGINMPETELSVSGNAQYNRVARAIKTVSPAERLAQMQAGQSAQTSTNAAGVSATPSAHTGYSLENFSTFAQTSSEFANSILKQLKGTGDGFVDKASFKDAEKAKSFLTEAQNWAKYFSDNKEELESQLMASNPGYKVGTVDGIISDLHNMEQIYKAYGDSAEYWGNFDSEAQWKVFTDYANVQTQYDEQAATREKLLEEYKAIESEEAPEGANRNGKGQAYILWKNWNDAKNARLAAKQEEIDALDGLMKGYAPYLEQYNTGKRIEAAEEKVQRYDMRTALMLLKGLNDNKSDSAEEKFEALWLVNYFAKEIPNAEDFAKYSNTVVTPRYIAEGITGNKLNLPEYMPDEDYEYICQVGNSRGGGLTKDEKAVLDSIPDEEVAVYKYIYAKYGSEVGQTYLDQLKDGSSYYIDAQNKAKEYIDNYTSKYGTAQGKNANFWQKLGIAAEQGWDNFFENAVTAMTGDIEKTSANDYAFASARENSNWLGKFALDSVQTGANMAPSILTSIIINGIAPGSQIVGQIGSVAGSALMGMSAGGGAYADAIKQGYSEEQAKNYGIIIGALEGGLQTLIGGVGKLKLRLNGQSANLIETKIHGITNRLLKLGAKAGVNMASEGFEEGLQEFLAPVVASVVFDEKYTPAEAGDIAYAALLGGVMGFFGGEGIDPELEASVQRDKVFSSEKATSFATSLIANNAESSYAHKVGQQIINALDRGEVLTNGDIMDISSALAARAQMELVNNTRAENKNAASDADTVESGAATDSIVKKIKTALPELRMMQSVSKIDGTEIPAGTKPVDRLVAFVKNIGNKINRPGFGDVLFSRSKLKASMVGHGFGAAKVETFAAVPDVIAKGRQIDYQENWKGSGYDSYLFAAPITYKSETAYVGAVVHHDKQSNRYYLHEVVDEHGNLIYKNEEPSSSASDRLTTLEGDRDTVAENESSSTPIISDVDGNSNSEIEYDEEAEYAAKPEYQKTTNEWEADINAATILKEGKSHGMSETNIKKLQSLSRLLNRQIRLYTNEAEGGDTGGFFDHDTGAIYINAKCEDPVMQTLSHELTHSLEGTSYYNQLAEYVRNNMQWIAKVRYDVKKAEIEAAYRDAQEKGVIYSDNVDGDHETVAWFVEHYLLKDERQIRRLCETKQSLGRKILNWFDRLLSSMGNIKAINRQQLQTMRDLYKKALDEVSGRGDNVNIAREELAYARRGMETGRVTDEQFDAAYDEYAQLDLDRNLDVDLGETEHKLSDRTPTTDGGSYLNGDHRLFPNKAEWHEFDRSFANKTSDMKKKRSKPKRISINTGEAIYLINATRYMEGEIVLRISLNTQRDINIANEYERSFINGTDTIRDRPDRWAEGIWGREGRGSGYNDGAQKGRGTKGTSGLYAESSESDGAGYNGESVRDSEETEQDRELISGEMSFDDNGEYIVKRDVETGKTYKEYIDENVSAREYRLSRSAQEQSDVLSQVRDFLAGKISKSDLQSFVEGVDGDTSSVSSADTFSSKEKALGRLSGEAREIVFAAREAGMSVDEYLRSNAEMYEVDGEYSAAAKEALDSERGGRRAYKVDPDFAKAVDDWDGKSKVTFNVGVTSDILKSIGVKDRGIVWHGGKAAEIMRKHPNMTKEVIKQVPNIMEDPVLVLKSQQHDSRLVIFGELIDVAGDPVLAILELEPTTKGGEVMNINVIASAYGKDSNPAGFIMSSDLLYIDANKNRTQEWVQSVGLQLPSDAITLGSVGSITYPDGKVKITGVPAKQYMQYASKNANRSHKLSDTTSGISSMPKKVQNHIEKAENGVVRGIAESLHIRGNDNKAQAKDILRAISEEFMESGTVTSESMDNAFEKLFDLGDTIKDESYKAWMRNDIAAAINDMLRSLTAAKRFETSRNEEITAAAEIPQTMEELTDVWDKFKTANKAYDKVMSKNLFTEEDKLLIGRLLRGETDISALENITDNAEAIKEAYEARQEYERYAKVLRAYRRQHNSQLKAVADSMLTTALEWRDKGMGILYERETMERNLRDIIPDRTLADKIISTYITPIHHTEAEANREKNRYRARIKALKLDDKPMSAKDIKNGRVSEAYAVQFIGEARDNIRRIQESRGRLKQIDGKTEADWNGAIASLWENNPKLDREKIDNAIEEFRKIYDELFTAMNEVRIKNGYEPINYRKGYFPHFQLEGEGGIMSLFGKVFGISTDVLPTSINGMTHTFKPGISWFANAQERLGFATVYDAVEGFDRYIEGAMNVIYHTDNIQRLRALASQIRYNSTSDGIRAQVDAVLADKTLTEQDRDNRIRDIYEKGRFTLSNFAAHLDEYTNLLAGKKSLADRTMEYGVGRTTYNTVSKFSGRVAANMIVGNVASALTNFIPIVQAGAAIPSADILRGMYATLKNIKESDGIAEQSDFITNRRGSHILKQTGAEKVSEFGMLLMEAIDNFTSETIVRARRSFNEKRGMSEQAAIEEADAFAAGVIADRSRGAMPTLFYQKNPVTKLLTQFQLEVNNQYSYMFKDLPEEAKSRGLKVIAGMILKLIVGSFLYNEMYEFAIGRRPAFDILGIINDTVGDLSGYELPNVFELGYDALLGDGITAEDFKTDKKTVGGAVAALGENIVEELPFTGALSLVGIGGDGGRIPIGNALPDLTVLYNAITNGDWAPNKRWHAAMKELFDTAVYTVPPFGGGVLKKLVESTDVIVQGGSYKISADGKKQLQYSGPDNVLDAVRVLLFGKTSLPTAQEWINSGFKTLSVRETATYLSLADMGEMEKSEIFKLIKELKGCESKVERLQMLSASELSQKGKGTVYYSLYATDAEIDMFNALADMGADYLAVAAEFAAIERETEIDAEGETKYKNVTKAQKIGALLQTNLDDEELYTALHHLNPDKDGEKSGEMKNIDIAQEYGITAGQWATIRYEILPNYDENGNGSLNGAEVAEALATIDDGFDGIVLPSYSYRELTFNSTQLAVLWQLLSGSTSGKNNPYKTSIGNKVAAQRWPDEE